MKEQLLSALGDSDRAALQGLVPLAGALGAGTIFALFGSSRRRADLAVFEIFAAAAVLACVATTAYFAISLLHLDQPIGDRELSWTATPLLIAILLLILLAAFDRLPGGRLWALAPLAILALFAGLLLSSLTWEAEPADAPAVAGAILAVGVVLSLLAWVIDRAVGGWDRREAQRRLVRLSGRGFRPAERTLALGLPSRTDVEQHPCLTGWERRGKFYLDPGGAAQLAALVRERWDRHGEARDRPHRSEARDRPTHGEAIAFAAKAPSPLRLYRGDLTVVVFAHDGDGAAVPRPFPRSEDGLFDVTELVEPASLE